MSTTAVVAYVPVLHDGYRRFLERHAPTVVWVVGEALVDDDRALAKDIRRLPAASVAAALASWGFDARVLDEAAAATLGESGTPLVLPGEDVSYRLVERWFGRSPVVYDTVFLRWDRTRTVQLLEPTPERVTDALPADLAAVAEAAAGTSVDWWRQVGAALATTDGHVLVATNRHLPHEWSPYAAGDPRSNFFQGVHLELSTAEHAEAQLIATAAREGRSTAGATVYVTDFPCPPCAKLLAGAGVASVHYRQGYAVLDGEDVLRAAGVEIVLVT